MVSIRPSRLPWSWPLGAGGGVVRQERLQLWWTEPGNPDSQCTSLHPGTSGEGCNEPAPPFQKTRNENCHVPQCRSTAHCIRAKPFQSGQSELSWGLWNLIEGHLQWKFVTLPLQVNPNCLGIPVPFYAAGTIMRAYYCDGLLAPMWQSSVSW